jgi:hypothetical protein
MPSYRGEPASLHPKFPEGSVAGCVRLDEPPPKEQDNLVYTPEDDKVLEDFIRQSAEATPHSVRGAYSSATLDEMANFPITFRLGLSKWLPRQKVDVSTIV